MTIPINYRFTQYSVDGLLLYRLASKWLHHKKQSGTCYYHYQESSRDQEPRPSYFNVRTECANFSEEFYFVQGTNCAYIDELSQPSISVSNLGANAPHIQGLRRQGQLALRLSTGHKRHLLAESKTIHVLYGQYQHSVGQRIVTPGGRITQMRTQSTAGWMQSIEASIYVHSCPTAAESSWLNRQSPLASQSRSITKTTRLAVGSHNNKDLLKRKTLVKKRHLLIDDDKIHH